MPQNIEKTSCPPMMEVKTSIDSSMLNRDMRASPVMSCHMPKDAEGGGASSPSPLTAINNISLLPDVILQNNLWQLQQHQQFEQEFLVRHFQEEQQRLTEAHKQELKKHLEHLEEQTRLANQESVRRQRLEAIRMKDKTQYSANASLEMKQILNERLRLKQKQQDGSDPNVSGVGTSSGIRVRPGSHLLSNPEDFPLRKTASEPNICFKLKLKPRVLDHRSSPITKPKDRQLLGLAKRRSAVLISNADGGSNPDSGQSSPPNGLPTSRSSSGSTPIHEEGSSSLYATPLGSGSDLTHPFSSLPNISLGKPPHSCLTSAARSGVPLTGHILPSSLPNYPTLPILDGDACGVGTPSLIHPSLLPNLTPNFPVGSLVGHSYLMGGALIPGQQSKDNQHIRQAVLKKAGSKNHVENVEEETEAAVAEAIGSENATPQVIDLTDNRRPTAGGRSQGSLRPSLYSPDRLSLLQEARDHYSLKPPSAHSSHSSNLPYGSRSGSHSARPLSRTLSSPLVTLSPTAPHQMEPVFSNKQGATTGLVYDSLMEKHQCLCGVAEAHPEHAGRIQAIWSRLQDTGLAPLCYRLGGRKATLEEIQSCHSEAHTVFFGTNPLNRQHLDFRKLGEMPIKNFVKLQCGGIGVDSDTTWHEIHTSPAARLAVGCALELAFKVSTGELRNGFAIVRPPGHHAEYQQAMGFCFFNTVAIVAKQLLHKLSLQKILIVDWDVHHGNGTQAAFFEDPHVLYVSLHRFDEGSFFPGTGGPTEVGEGDGIGFNVNVAFQGGLNPPMGDAEYLSAFRNVVMPIAKEFAPDIILVSAGFDASYNHPPTLGGYEVSPACFAHMTSSLMTLAQGKVSLILEGGYEVESICDASEACVRALLGESPPTLSQAELSRRPAPCAIESLQNAIACQSSHWPVLQRYSAAVGMSHLEATSKEDDVHSAPVSAMASLNVNHGSQHVQEQSNPIPSEVTVDSEETEDEPMDHETE